MLRQKIRLLILNKKAHPHFKKVARFMILVGILWILSFPYMARNVFTSENALHASILKTKFGQEPTAFTEFKNIQSSLSRADDHQQFILEYLSGRAEVHVQPLQTKKGKVNLYLYLRSPRGYGNECNIMTLPINYKASVANGLTFFDVWDKQAPNWQAKDLIILFYEDSDYALSVKEFLEVYYHTKDQSTDQSNNESFFSQKIQGRCGYLRQSFPFVMTDYDYNKVSLFYNGINTQLSDIDFYDATRQALQYQSFQFDFTMPAYFRKNPYLEKVMKVVSQIRGKYLIGLEQVLALFDMKLKSNSSLLPMLESLKNSFLGKVHDPHSHFIEHGVHSITLKMYKDSNANNINEKDKVMRTISLMEHMTRMTDQLDEQLNAGFYFYILTTKTNFVSLAVFVYPVVLIIAGYFIPAFFNYVECGDSKGKSTALLFVTLAYAIGFFCSYLPRIFLKYGQNVASIAQGSSFCLADKQTQNEGTTFTLIAIAAISALYLTFFKFLQKGGMTNLWVYVKSYNWFVNSMTTGALVVYQFPISLINSIFVYPLLHNAQYLGKGLLQSIISLILLTLSAGIGFLFLFGTLIEQNKSQGVMQTTQHLTREAILDYECVGSNVWLYICMLLVPNCIVLIKILTN